MAMTYEQVVQYVKQAYLSIPLVKTFVMDIQQVNSYPNLQYCAVAVDLGLAQGADNKGIASLSMSIAVFDRMYDHPSDSSSVRNENNYVSAFSKCAMISDTALSMLDDYQIVVEEHSHQPFEHRYADQCAGCLTQVTLRFPQTLCWDESFDQ